MIIRSAAPLGFRPDEVRAMIPRDWMLIKRGYDDQGKVVQAGSDAPQTNEVAEMVRLY